MGYVTRPKVRFMRINIAIMISLILITTAFTSMALATDPLVDDSEDEKFLMSDPDGDQIITLDEFQFGTDPFNSDSDNDGLPDFYEVQYSPLSGNTDSNALMDPTDPSDSHLDFDYLPRSNGSSFSAGEQDATFDAVKKLKGGQLVAWPSDPDVLFIQPFGDEAGPHYDNYEEFYRPYTDVENGNVIRYMQTNPTYPDTDGDGILDPDDYEPLGWANDGTSPGANDEPGVVVKDKIDNVLVEDGKNGMNIESYDGFSENDFDITMEQPQTTDSRPTEDNRYLPKKDVDNDGI